MNGWVRPRPLLQAFCYVRSERRQAQALATIDLFPQSRAGLALECISA